MPNFESLLTRWIASASEYAIVLIDPNGTILSWNEGAHSKTGYPPVEIIGKPFSLLFPPDDRRLVDDALKRARDSGHFVWPCWSLRKNGGLYWAQISASVLRENGEPVSGYVITIDDASTMKSAEEARQQQEEKFNLLMTGVQEYAIFMMDPEGRITDWNSAAERLLGYTSEEVMGHSFSIFFTPEEIEAGNVAQLELRQAAQVGRATDDRWHVRKDGTHFWASGITSALRDARGSLRGFAKVLRDSTDRKRYEEEMRAKTYALEEADRRKDEFLAMLAHELRNPLAPVATAVTLLQNQVASGSIDPEPLAVLERQVGKLTRLINDLMDVSRITRGKIQLNRARIDLRRVVESAVESASSFIKEQNHTLHVDLPPDPLWMSGDETRLEQVLENLLNNAAKYTMSGGTITVSAKRVDGNALISVRDNGIGIPPELLPKIFDLFTQADHSLDRSQGGLGIGLTIARNLVEMHGGSIEVSTEGLGKGSEFAIRFPLEVQASSQVGDVSQKAVSASAPKRFLVVDDNADAAKMLAALLQMIGHEVDTALCGNDALLKAETYRPHVMLLDIGLPGLDGYQLARRFREQDGTKDMILVAVTGYGTPEARQRSKEAGFNFHLVKPVQLENIQEILESIEQSASN